MHDNAWYVTKVYWHDFIQSQYSMYNIQVPPKYSVLNIEFPGTRSPSIRRKPYTFMDLLLVLILVCSSYPPRLSFCCLQDVVSHSDVPAPPQSPLLQRNPTLAQHDLELLGIPPDASPVLQPLRHELVPKRSQMCTNPTEQWRSASCVSMSRRVQRTHMPGR